LKGVVVSTIASNPNKTSEGEFRARPPDSSGYVERNGLRTAYETFGDSGPVIVFVPSWAIVHQRQWKAQVPYFARHARVVTFDPLGNGRSDRPESAAAYSDREAAAGTLAVMDALGVERAALVGLSGSVGPALILAAEHPGRVDAVVAMGASVPLAGGLDDVDFEAVYDRPQGWERYTRHSWLNDYHGFLEWFVGMVFTEPHSTWAQEYTMQMALETSGEVLVRTYDGGEMDAEETRRIARAITCPVLVIHGDGDRLCSLEIGAELARETGGPLVTIVGGGHASNARDPVRVNHVLRDFLLPRRPVSRWTRALARQRRALYVSSPIGLGHARRDIAIADELRKLRPDLEIEWLTQHPVTEMLAAHGERIHPASSELLSESAHWSAEAHGHELDAFDATRRMDEILIANFMLFDEVAHDGCYDLWIGDEAWDVDYFLHENPERKCAAYAWLTDFEGMVALPDGGEHEASVVADLNAEMVEHVERFPRIRDASIFVGDPADIPPGRFGPGLPEVRAWAKTRYSFAGYITGLDQPAPDAHAALRRRLGYTAPTCMVAVGGSGIGEALLGRAVEALPEARRTIPDLRMVAVCGPRIDPAVLPASDGLEVLPYVEGLHHHLAACDTAVVQGGLTTTMELVAAGRPFVYVPLNRHFEQLVHVRHRLVRHGAGKGLAFDDATPAALAEAIVGSIGTTPNYRPVPRDGAARAAAVIAKLI
jgi:pimeloyl-ACP methyl ester carboxylesterase/predicted glycosyltransferase